MHAPAAAQPQTTMPRGCSSLDRANLTRPTPCGRSSLDRDTTLSRAGAHSHRRWGEQVVPRQRVGNHAVHVFIEDVALRGESLGGGAGAGGVLLTVAVALGDGRAWIAAA